MQEKTFKELEHEGWVAKAGAYRDTFARITEKAIGPTLDACGAMPGKRVLDIACGTGELAEAARARGAAVTAVDFAATMVDACRARYAGIDFREGDAESLAFEDASFDVVTCAFGLLHLQDPEAAIGEALRVLEPGGCYAFTVWCGPDQGGDLFSLVLGAIERHGTLDVALPPAPPIFRFAKSAESERVLRATGFRDVTSRVLPLEWHIEDPQEILDLLYKSVVRLPMILAAQTEDARTRIHQAILDGARDYRSDDGAIKLRLPARLMTALKD